ncbi:FecR family protein [Desertivirga brevis]|uniref:FecR family protein n=1 Tax=Desertivirga brevis TaxID=2810310 RepID=UPI001A9626A5|nr:FecR family protein [Pedobacter sp. SYSU D00873]
MTDNSRWRSIINFLAAESRKEEVEELQRWLDADQENYREFNRIKMLWEETSKAPSSNTWEAPFNQLREQISVDRSDLISVQRRSLKTYLMQAAAVIIALIGISFWIYRSQQHNTDYAMRRWIDKTAGPGTVKRLLLPDSTEIWLNSGSKLSYLSNFGTAEVRKVKLSGEAYFKVKRDTLRPFTIESGQLNTRVLGTSFTIRAFPGEQASKVTVHTGKVAVHKVTDSSGLVHLLPNQSASLNRETGRFLKEDVDNDAEARAWVDGNLVFRQEPMANVFKVMERKYGYAFRWSGDFENCRFNGKFEKPALLDVLKVLEKSLGIAYSIKNKEVFIKGGNCM